MRIIMVIMAAMALAGCASMGNRFHKYDPNNWADGVSPIREPRYIFPGTQSDLRKLAIPFWSSNDALYDGFTIIFYPVFLIDLPFSFVADVVFIPYDAAMLTVGGRTRYREDIRKNGQQAAALSLASAADEPSVRLVSHQCGYERIFMGTNTGMAKGMKVLEDVDDSRALELDARYEAIFQDDRRERTNLWSHPLLSSNNVRIAITSPSACILPDFEIGNLLRDCAAIPKERWLRHFSPDKPRYVLSCSIETIGNVVIDLHPKAVARVFFEDGTYVCLMERSYSVK